MLAIGSADRHPEAGPFRRDHAEMVQQIATESALSRCCGFAQSHLRIRYQASRVLRESSLPGGIIRRKILRQSAGNAANAAIKEAGGKSSSAASQLMEGAFFLGDHAIEIYLRSA